MTSFLAEIFLPPGEGALERALAQARRACRDSRASGIVIEHLQAIHVPEDETCFLLFEAPSQESLCAAVRGAGLECNRVAAARGARPEERVR